MGLWSYRALAASTSFLLLCVSLLACYICIWCDISVAPRQTHLWLGHFEDVLTRVGRLLLVECECH